MYINLLTLIRINIFCNKYNLNKIIIYTHVYIKLLFNIYLVNCILNNTITYDSISLNPITIMQFIVLIYINYKLSVFSKK